jgi:glycosyltransferase involved in cell wall biosynthesis
VPSSPAPPAVTTGHRPPGRWKILHSESSLGFGGQEIRTLQEVRWLQANGWDALFACQPGSRSEAEARAAGVPTVTVAMASSLDARAALVLRRLMLAQDVALVHTHSSIDSWLATLAAKSLRLPVVRTRHVSIPVRPRRALVYHLADRIITSGERVKAIVAAAGVRRDKIVPISAGLDTTRFHPGVSGARVREELGAAGPLVGLVANIRGSKGHRIFLDAAGAVLRTRPDARFAIVGDGVGYAEVQRRVAELGLGEHVVLTGFRRDVPEVMAALDVLVLSSVKSEATPQVIPQALAVGTPVVGTTVGGIPELVRDRETGRLVPPDDPIALAAAIVEVLSDPEAARRMVARGQALVTARFSLEATMRETTDVYRDLLTPR